MMVGLRDPKPQGVGTYVDGIRVDHVAGADDRAR